VGYAFVIAKPGADLKSEDLIGFCDGQLARYKWPKKILVEEDFPRTALGKVRKTVLRENYFGEHKS
jgi:acyl-CoA synthetase (AMP-forming)/AMP-acid ligase II